MREKTLDERPAETPTTLSLLQNDIDCYSMTSIEIARQDKRPPSPILEDTTLLVSNLQVYNKPAPPIRH